MRDETAIIVAGMVISGASYIAYVLTTHGDGIALASAFAAIGGLAGYVLGRSGKNAA